MHTGHWRSSHALYWGDRSTAAWCAAVSASRSFGACSASVPRGEPGPQARLAELGAHADVLALSGQPLLAGECFEWHLRAAGQRVVLRQHDEHRLDRQHGLVEARWQRQLVAGIVRAQPELQPPRAAAAHVTHEVVVHRDDVLRVGEHHRAYTVIRAYQLR